MQRAIDAFGQVHFLFNSAGAAIRRAKFLEIDDELLARTFDLNVKGTLYGMQAVLPHMLRNKFGVIVNVGSMAHRRGGPGQLDPLRCVQGRGRHHDDGRGTRVRNARYPRTVDLARPGEDAVPRCCRKLARIGAAVPRRRADETLRCAGRNWRTGVVHVFGTLANS